jgi:hypothetical protein
VEAVEAVRATTVVNLEDLEGVLAIKPHRVPALRDKDMMEALRDILRAVAVAALEDLEEMH